MATITNFETLGKFFVGQGDMLIFDTPTDYSTATLASLANPKSLGDIKGDSTSWTGDDASISNIVNEQGNNVVSYVKAGTLSFEAEILSTSPEIIKKFFRWNSSYLWSYICLWSNMGFWFNSNWIWKQITSYRSTDSYR